MNAANNSKWRLVIPANYEMGEVVINYNYGVSKVLIMDFLKNNQHSLALLLYKQKDSDEYHSVVCAYDSGGYYFRDSGLDSVSEKTHDDQSLEDLVCYEFIPVSLI